MSPTDAAKGRNASFRDNFRSLQEWRRNYDARLSGYHDLSVPDEQFGKNGQIIEGPLFSSEGQLPDDLLHRTTQLVFHYQAGRKIPKLREPRNLYALTKEAGPQQATRWPSHMQVVCPAIRFLEYNPPIPDPLYKHTGKEPTPAVRGSQLGEMIYYNDPGRDLYFMRSRVAGCRLAMVSTTLTPREYPEDNLTLEFESRFESGNLLKVDKLSDFEYELTLRTDLYTNKHTQWFFFRVRNMRPEQTYRFTIVNLMKPSSLYNHGMRPVFYSEMNAKKNKIGWVRGGSNIRYYRNNLGGRDGRTYYGLTWTCEFPYKDDCCYFAHCFPYTYTDLQEYLLEVANDPVRSRICKQRVLCRTLAGNLVYILTITSPSRNPEISRAKRAVVLTARVHPGETNASWMMKGFLDYLTGNSADAKLLRDTFIFKIVPMLNPDGVIVGNYRCSLAGRDLNRNYKSVLKDSFPSIWHTKMMIKRLNSEREVVLYCDLHGHSRKNNIFIYGCENKHNPQKRLHERIFPLMLNKNASSFFCFNSCKYKVQKSKEGTGRIVMWYMGIPNSYTMEATFGGASLPGKRKDTHLSTRDLEMMGYYFCDTLLDYCDPDPSKVNACLKELQDRMRKQIMRRLQMQNAGLPLSDDFNIDDYMSEMESDTSGSDSSCDDGLPVHLLAIAPKLQRKKKMRSRRERSKVPATKTVIPSAADSSKQVVTTHSAKTTTDKTKTLRYSQNSSARRRSEHHVTSSANQHQAANDDRSGDRSTKKLATVSLKYGDPMLGIFISGLKRKRTDYLEVLTSAYLRSGVLMIPDPAKDYPLRYTNNGGNPNDGNFAVKYLANHLGSLSPDGSNDSKSSSPLMRNASCQWSPQPDTQGSDSGSTEEIDKEAIIAEEQYELLRQSALRRQLSAGQQRMLAQRHLVAVAAMQQRKDGKRISSATSDRASGNSLIRQHPNPFEDGKQKDNNASDTFFMTSQMNAPNSRSASATIASQEREVATGGSRSATFGKSRNSNVRETSATRGAFAGDQKSFKKSPTTPLSTETTVTTDPTKSIITKQQDDKLTTISTKHKTHYFTNRSENIKTSDTLGDGKTIHDKTPQKQDETSTSVNETSISVKDDSTDLETTKEQAKNESANNFQTKLKPQKLPWEKNEKTEKAKPKAAIQPEQNENSFLFNSEPIFAGKSEKVSGNVPETGKEGKTSTHPRRVDGLGHKKVPTINRASMHGLIKGEMALTKSPETSNIPSGIKKTTSVIMESDPDKLSVQSNRYLRPGSISDIHSSHYRAKNYQSGEDSFFGMSDRVGPSLPPRGGNVPPVVANIAELRRSLMGQGREGSDIPPRRVTTNPSNQPSEESRLDNGIPFSQRPKRKQPLGGRLRSRDDALHHNDNNHRESYGSPKHFDEVETSRSEPRKRHHNDYLLSSKPLSNQRGESPLSIEEKLKEDTKSRFRKIFNEDELDPDEDEDVDNLSTVANLVSRRRGHQHPGGRRRTHDHLNDSPELNQHPSDAKDQDGEMRSYSKGNATIEKVTDTSMTNIRIGSRTNEFSLRFSEKSWVDLHHKRDNANSGKSEKQVVTSVSLNMEGDKDERSCVTTPALARRPVPTMLRYLSAKQGQNKKKS
ncbi:uncharacterized protein LOC100183529 isoform X4 [Ciona intestinalis]